MYTCTFVPILTGSHVNSYACAKPMQILFFACAMCQMWILCQNNVFTLISIILWCAEVKTSENEWKWVKMSENEWKWKKEIRKHWINDIRMFKMNKWERTKINEINWVCIKECEWINEL